MMGYQLQTARIPRQALILGNTHSAPRSTAAGRSPSTPPLIPICSAPLTAEAFAKYE